MKRLLNMFSHGVTVGVIAAVLVYLAGGFQGRRPVPDQAEHPSGDSSVPAVAGRTTLPRDRVEINEEISTSRRNVITGVIQQASPAVVGITVTQVREVRMFNPLFEDPFFRYFFGVPQSRNIRQKVENIGSGFLVSSDGYVVTNEHVVHNASEVVVTMTNGSKYPAELIGLDFDTDLALLKIDGKSLPYLPIGKPDDVIVGEWVMAIGNPFGLFEINDQPSVSVGVVSALDRDFERNERGRLYRDMIQTDAAINRGNSGGPLLNVTGEVIGVNTFIFSESGGSVGVGFAIPAAHLQDVIDQLKIRGEIDRDFWTGLYIRNIERLIALSLGLDNTNGAIVTDVEKGSPAEKAGLKATDIIVEIEDTPVTDTGTIRNYIVNHDLRVGDTIDGEFFRDGRIHTFTMKLEARLR